MGQEGYPHNKKEDIEALTSAIAKATALFEAPNRNYIVPGLHEYDKVSCERINRIKVQISISGRGVYSLFMVNEDTRKIESESYKSIDDTREEDDTNIHLQRIELINNKLARN